MHHSTATLRKRDQMHEADSDSKPVCGPSFDIQSTEKLVFNTLSIMKQPSEDSHEGWCQVNSSCEMEHKR
jgi:hypothetical protein